MHTQTTHANTHTVCELKLVVWPRNDPVQVNQHVCVYESFKPSQRRQALISTLNQTNQRESEGNVISYDNTRILMIHK